MANLTLNTSTYLSAIPPESDKLDVGHHLGSTDELSSSVYERKLQQPYFQMLAQHAWPKPKYLS